MNGWLIYLFTDYKYLSYLFRSMGTVCNGQNLQTELSNPQGGISDNKQKLMNTTAPPDLSNNENMGGQQSIGQLNLSKAKKQEEDQFQRITMFSTKTTNRISFQSLQVIDSKQKHKRINQFQIEAPYQIIGLTISKELRATINRIGRDIFAKYIQDENIKSGWKLHKNGYYINYLGKKITAIFTQHSYYQGELYDEDNKILPKAKGILVTENGRYEGDFQKGKAHGRGNFEDYKKNAFYNGRWEHGKMIEGVIQCPQYKYKGKLKNGIAHGAGELHFKERQVFYLGKFKKGIYYDKQGIYETPDYVYQGCFMNGEKNGQGTLVQKQRNYNKDKKLKYRPPTQYQGQFSKDIFLNKPPKEQTKTPLETDGAGAKDNATPNLQPEAFEQEQEVEKKPQDQNNPNSNILQQDYDMLKPKFIWVQPPRPKKAKKVEIDVDQF